MNFHTNIFPTHNYISSPILSNFQWRRKSRRSCLRQAGESRSDVVDFWKEASQKGQSDMEIKDTALRNVPFYDPDAAANLTPSDLKALLEADPSEFRDDDEEDTDFDVAFRKGVKYLKSIGLTDKVQLIRVLDICMNPYSQFALQMYQSNAEAKLLDVDTDIKPVVETLQEFGLDNKAIVRMIQQHPPILCYPAEQRLRPWVQYMTDLGIKDVAALIRKRPSLLGLKVDENLKKIVRFLLESDEKSIEEVLELLETSI